MIIFGWGHTSTKNFGPTFEQTCPNCNNSNYWILSRIRVWFTLFFIPVIPYENKYFLSCPVCQQGLTLNSQQANEIKPIAEVNQLLVDGHITKEEYQKRILALNDETQSKEPVRIHDGEPETIISAKSSKQRFCSECGNKVTIDARFCSSCGTNTDK